MKNYRQYLLEIQEAKDVDPKFQKEILTYTIKHFDKLIKTTKDKTLQRKYLLTQALIKRQLFDLGLT